MREPRVPGARHVYGAALLLFLFLLAPSTAVAQITMLSAQPDATANVLTVNGSPFAPGLRILLFIDTFVELPVLTVSATQATATLPSPIVPGTYLLFAYQPSTGKYGTFNVTIGAVGPPGPAGAAGAAGPPGPPGTNGADGTSVQSTALGAGDANCPNGGSKFVAVTGTTYACNGSNGGDGVMAGSVFFSDSTFGRRIVLQNSFVEIDATCQPPDEAGYVGSIGFKNGSAVRADSVVWDVSGVSVQDIGEFEPAPSHTVDQSARWGTRVTAQIHWTDGHAGSVSATMVYKVATSPFGITGCLVHGIGMVK
jgi:hypothetical protein